MSNLPNNEPPNGDFVAYLKAIEREQIRALKLHGAAAEALAAASEIVAPHSARTPEPSRPAARGGEKTDDAETRPHDRAQAKALRQQLATGGRAGSSLVGGLFMGFLGLVLLLSGLFSDGGWVLVGIGAILLWRMWVAVAAVVREAQTNVATLARRKLG